MILSGKSWFNAGYNRRKRPENQPAHLGHHHLGSRRLGPTNPH
jgi:hypothetical protein